MKSLTILLGLIVLTPVMAAAQNFLWTHTSGPNGQRIFDMISPSGDSIYAAVYGGVYLSTNNGDTWNSASEGMTDIGILALAQADDGTLYAGSSNGAVYQSTNGGQSWETKTPLPGEYTITGIKLAANGHLIVGTSRDGLFHSDDGGDIWTEANNGLTDLHIAALITSLTGTLYVGTRIGPFRSNDNGASWIAINTGLADTEVTGLAANSAGHIYASVESTEAVIYSSDEGETWEGIGSDIGYPANSVAVNADNDVFAGASPNLFFRANSGIEWVQLYDDLPEGYFDPIFIQSDGDVFMGRFHLHAKGNQSPDTTKDTTLYPWGCALHRSTDNGTSWDLTVTGLGHISCTNLAVKSDNLIIAGTFDYGLYRSSDNGNTWVMANEGNGSPVVEDIIVANNGRIYAAMEYKLLRSTNDGLSWETKDIGGEPGPLLECLAVGNGDNVYAASNQGVHYSTNGGSTWEVSNRGLPLLSFSHMAVNTVGDVFVTCYNQGIYRSTDTAATWTEVNNGITDFAINSIAAGGQGELYVGTYWDGLYKSTDNGDSWVNLTTTPEFARVNAIAVREVSGYVYISSYDLDAIYRSTDGGYTWEPNNYGDAPSRANDFYFDNDGNLYVAGSGIYRSSFNYVCGDANEDWAFGVGDVVYVINYIFKAGPIPLPALDSGDANCDGQVNVGDAVFGITYIFKSGPPPCCP